MDKTEVLELMRRVKDGNVSPEDALEKMRLMPFEDLGYAKVDHHRAIRQGAGEVIYGQNKTPEQIISIVEAMQKAGTKDILITRISKEAAEHIESAVPIEYHPGMQDSDCFTHKRQGKNGICRSRVRRNERPCRMRGSGNNGRNTGQQCYAPL